MRTHSLTLMVLLLTACSFQTASEDQNDGNNGAAGRLADTNPSGRVCVYEYDSFFTCAGAGETQDDGLRCVDYDDLDICIERFDGRTICEASCCLDESTFGHRIVDGPCDQALAREEAETGSGGSG